MTRDNVIGEYFNWMCRLISEGVRPARGSYRKLLAHLNNREFTYILGMDGNRAEDGVELRYRFGYSYNYHSAVIARYLDNKPCSVLEMMTALAMRCEDQIMEDPDIGDRTGQWFWGMIDNLGLKSMSDSCYNRAYVDHVLDIFLNREYGRNGEGGLFTVRNARCDLRTEEIWYQMCWYLDEVLEK